jgi:hypothetical protein
MTEHSELRAWLDELVAEQASKALVIASLRQKLGIEGEDDSSPPAPQTTATPARNSAGAVQHHGPLRADTFFGLSIPDAIKKYLAIMKRPQSPRAIADALQEGGVLSQATNFYLNVVTALKRLREAGVVVKTKEGWGLSVWYPNRKVAELPRPKVKRNTAKGKLVARLSKPRTKRVRKSATKNKGNTGWHDFLAGYLREGKSMKAAAADWKQRKEAKA